MYTILVTNSHELVTTKTERIMKRSKLVNWLHFLMNTNFEGLDMTDFTCCLEYVLPVSKEYRSEVLERSEELYKGKIEYLLPLDTDLTAEAGEIELQLSFTWFDFDSEGNSIQYVRKTSPTTLTIYPIAAWSDLIPDDALGAIDQRLIKVDAILEALGQMDLSDVEGLQDALKDLVVEDNKISGVRLTGEQTTEYDIVTPKINDGEYDGDYDGILELDDSASSGGSGGGSGTTPPSP